MGCVRILRHKSPYSRLYFSLSRRESTQEQRPENLHISLGDFAETLFGIMTLFVGSASPGACETSYRAVWTSTIVPGWVLAHIFNLSIQQTEADKCLLVQGQPG